MATVTQISEENYPRLHGAEIDIIKLVI